MTDNIQLQLSPASKVPNFNGRYSSICLHHSHDVAVCAYDDLIVGQGLHFSVGMVNKKRCTIDWGASSCDPECTGNYPSVSLMCLKNEFYIIETHTGGFLNNSCYCRVGKIDRNQKSIDWGDSYFICSGGKPTVCANDDGTVIIAHEEDHYLPLNFLMGDRILYDVFTVNTDDKSLRRVCNTSLPINGLTGVEPTIATSGNTVVRTVDNNSVVNWSASNSECGFCGRAPAISINANHIIESHMSTTFRKICYSYGYIQGNGIVWKSRSESDTFGEYPSISLADDGYTVEMHKVSFAASGVSSLFIKQGVLSSYN